MKRLIPVLILLAGMAYGATIADDMYGAYKGNTLTSLNLWGNFTTQTGSQTYILRTLQPKETTLYPVVTSQGCLLQVVQLVSFPVTNSVTNKLVLKRLNGASKLWLYSSPTWFSNNKRGTNVNMNLWSGPVGVFPPLTLQRTTYGASNFRNNRTNAYLIKVRNNHTTNSAFNVNINIW